VNYFNALNDLVEMITIEKVSTTRNLDVVVEAMEKLVDHLTFKPKKNRVFIKPNIVDAVPPREAVDTDPAIVAGLIIALNNKYKIHEFVIGDGSAYFSSKDKNWQRLIDESGYEKMVKHLEAKRGINVRLENLEKVERKEYPWKFGTIRLPALCETHSYLNVAKMKTHLHTMVTLTLKNQKGLLLLADKKAFHLGTKYGNLHESIKALAGAVSPELAIIDATKALEGTGPATAPEGQTNVRKLGLCIGAHSMAEADTAACKIMSIPCDLVMHLDEASVNLAEHSAPLQVATPPFIRPKIEVKMWNIYRHTFETCCTGCQMALSRTLRKIMFVPELRKKFGELQDKYKRIDLIMGKQSIEVIQEITEKGGTLIFFGNCTKDLGKKFDGIHIPGCSPDHNNAIEIIFKKLLK